jgi:hypothetical protein
MKKIIVLIGLMFMFARPAYSKPNEDSCIKDMLSNISSINSGWHPIVGNSLYQVKVNKINLSIVRLYDSFANDDPAQTYVQAIFVNKNNKCKMVSIIFSSIDLREYDLENSILMLDSNRK